MITLNWEVALNRFRSEAFAGKLAGNSRLECVDSDLSLGHVRLGTLGNLNPLLCIQEMLEEPFLRWSHEPSTISDP